MGEYIKINGKTVKLGTCEDLYYTSFQKLARAVNRAEYVPGNMQPREYLQTGWRYRFPFPDEADLQVGDDGPGHRFTRAAVWHARGEKVSAVVPHFEHGNIQASVAPHSRSEGVYDAVISLPCPQSDKWTGHAHSRNLVGICQQKGTVEHGKPQLWTVVCCPFCDAKTRLEPETALALAEEIADTMKARTDEDAAFWVTIAREIVAGYSDGNLFEEYGSYERALSAA